MLHLKLSLIIVTLSLSLSSCFPKEQSAEQEQVSSLFVPGPKGQSGEQTAIYQDSEGNVYGYYEYLPEQFIEFNADIALLFYWNGSNAITGNGQQDLVKLLSQGLPQLINQDRHFNTIIISAMMRDWKTADIAPFVDYIINRYKGHFDPNRIYMSGFSAGGGITIRYAADHAENLAAIAPIAPAIKAPSFRQPSDIMALVPSWFFHNSADDVVEVWRSRVWHQALIEKGGEHKITIYQKNGHYAWLDTYNNPEFWYWLLAKTKAGKEEL